MLQHGEKIYITGFSRDRIHGKAGLHLINIKLLNTTNLRKFIFNNALVNQAGI